MSSTTTNTSPIIISDHLFTITLLSVTIPPSLSSLYLSPHLIPPQITFYIHPLSLSLSFLILFSLPANSLFPHLLPFSFIYLSSPPLHFPILITSPPLPVRFISFTITTTTPLPLPPFEHPLIMSETVVRPKDISHPLSNSLSSAITHCH